MPCRRNAGAAPEVQRVLATYLDQDQKAKIDWSDPAQRTAHLQVLVQDADATLDLSRHHSEDDDVRQTGWLLTKILGDDVVTDDHGQPHLAKARPPSELSASSNLIGGMAIEAKPNASTASKARWSANPRRN